MSKIYGNPLATAISPKKVRLSTIDKICPLFAESGSVVVCEPVKGYPLGAVSCIEPVQSGTGDPSPENIRPISGYNKVKLTRCGKNLLNVAENLTFTGYIEIQTHIHAGTYKLTWASETHGGSKPPYIRFADNSTGLLLRPEWNGKDIVLTKDETLLLIYANDFSASGSDGISATISQFMLSQEGGSYEPYRGETFEINFGQTVYGGSLDWPTGALTVDKKVLTVDGTNLVFTANGTYWNLPQHTTPGVIYGTKFLNSHLPAGCFASNPGLGFIYARSQNVTEFASVDEFNAYLVEQNAAGTPLQIQYELENPITIQLTPQEILALSGINTLYSDTGETEVMGRTDPVAVINNLQNRLAALEAAVVNNA